MNDKQRLMIEGMDRLLRRFNKYPNDKEFTVEEIIEVSNEIYDEIVKEENQHLEVCMEFLSEHWVLIYGMFMYGMGLLTGSIKKKR